MARKPAYRSAFLLAGIFLFLSGTINTEADTDTFTVLSPPDHTSVEGELISIAIKLNDNDTEAIDIKVNGNNALPERESAFTADEFSSVFPLKALLNDLENEELEIEFTMPENTVNRLNEILMVPRLYDIYLKKNKPLRLTGRDQRLISETGFYRSREFTNLTNEQQKRIMKLNRLVLETVYPNTCPKKQHHMADVRGKKYFCKTVMLDYGPNEIEVIAVKKGNVAASKKIHSFYRSDLSKDYYSIRPPFSKREFHNNEREKECLQCHRLKASDIDEAPAKIADSPCYQCHKRLTAYTNVHGPVATWSCLKCHDRKGKPVRYQTPQPDKELCFKCHYEKKDEWSSKKYTHGPTATGKCTICHNPHASNNAYWLKKSPFELCTTCHDDRRNAKHVLAGIGAGGSGHPIQGRPDPFRAGNEFSCNSCHNPHAANSPSLFAHDVMSRFELCQKCHQK